MPYNHVLLAGFMVSSNWLKEIHASPARGCPRFDRTYAWHNAALTITEQSKRGTGTGGAAETVLTERRMKGEPMDGGCW